MTFNIHHGKGTDNKLDLKRIMEVIKNSKADIIGLNEVDKVFSKRSDFLDQIAYLAEHLEMYAAFGATFTLKSRQTNKRRQYGNALLSRYPIQSKQNHLFDFYAGILEGRGLLDVTLQLDTYQLNVMVTHLSLNPLLHKKQTNYIIKMVNQKHVPAIVLGDWNMRPKSTAWQKMTHSLIDVVTPEHALYTFPSFRPKTQLDYIFVSNEFRILSVNTIDNCPIASDHLPLTALLELN